MNHLSNRPSSTNNLLWQYVQSMQPETIAQLSQPEPEVAQIMENTIMQMLGALPSEHFNVAISTNREHLSRLLVSAMMNGYFLNNAKQRLDFEKSLSQSQDG